MLKYIRDPDLQPRVLGILGFLGCPERSLGKNFMNFQRTHGGQCVNLYLKLGAAFQAYTLGNSLKYSIELCSLRVSTQSERSSGCPLGQSSPDGAWRGSIGKRSQKHLFDETHASQGLVSIRSIHSETHSLPYMIQ